MPKKRKIIIVMLVTIELLTMFLMYKSSHNKKIELDKVELKELIDHNSFAVFLDGEEYTEETFPTDSLLDLENTQCMNEKGDILANPEITYSNNSLTINSKETTYCTLYFYKTISLGKFCEGQPTMNKCITNKIGTIDKVESMTNFEVGGMYRYQGTDNVNNWICFGTTDKTQCTSEEGIDKYMYRIIGVTPDGQLALIKETGVKEENTTTFQWNDKYQHTEAECGKDGLLCTWKNSKLYNRLNGLCNSSNADCDGTSSGQTNIFINSSYYDYLKDKTWLDRINTHTWKYGDTNQNNGSYNGDTIYEIENAFTDSVPNAKIGLQYLHDYYYAYPGGNPGSSSNAKNSWIHFCKDGYNSLISYEWLISRYGVHNAPVLVWRVASFGAVSFNYLNSNGGVRPVFYLKSDIPISNTAGSKEDPFMIT